MDCCINHFSVSFLPWYVHGLGGNFSSFADENGVIQSSAFFSFFLYNFCTRKKQVGMDFLLDWTYMYRMTASLSYCFQPIIIIALILLRAVVIVAINIDI